MTESTARDRAIVQQLFREGVAGFAEVARRLEGAAWQQPACGVWTAADTARHVLAVARWYHHWLDRAIAGEITRPFPSDEMDERNAADVADLAGSSGPDAVVEFQATALDYLERTEAHWERRFPYPYGVVTVGLHCALAASEWHLHAWDIATASGRSYRAAHAGELLRGVGRAEALRRRGVAGAVITAAAPLTSRINPWAQLLRLAGRA